MRRRLNIRGLVSYRPGTCQPTEDKAAVCSPLARQKPLMLGANS